MTAPYRVLTPQSEGDVWLRARQTGVGASESAAVLGVSKWGTALTVYEQKIADDVQDVTTDLMKMGHLAERMIVEFIESYPDRFGWMGQIIAAEGVWQSTEWPWLLASLDRMVITPDGHTVPLELKSVGDFQIPEWRVGEETDNPTVLPSGYEVPLKYQVQVQQQMAVTGTAFAYVAVWLGKGQIEIIRVDRDDAYIAEYLVGRIGDFWNYNVLTLTPPPPTINDDLWAIHPGDPELPPLDASVDLMDLIGQWRIATTDRRDLNKAIAELQFQIALALGDREEARDPLTGEIVHRLKGQKTARTTDLTTLESDYPEAYAKCVSEPGFTRVHRATKAQI